MLQPLALILATALLLTNAYAQGKAELNVDFGGYGGSECHKRTGGLQIAGSQADIVLIIRSWPKVLPYRGLPTEPDRLVFTATVEPSGSERANPVSYPLDRLHPQFYLSFHQLRADSAFMLTGRILESRPEYHFLITLPEDLAGKVLHLEAALDDPDYGPLHGTGSVNIVAPCLSRDREQVAGSYVMFAFNSRNYLRAMALTDSLLATGWRLANGLLNGMMAAAAYPDFDRNLRYLDIYYKTYGTVPFGDTDPDRAHESYQTLRASILEKCAKQQPSPPR